MNLSEITTENNIEELILSDLQEALTISNCFISILSSELKDDPDGYDYTMGDLEQFLFKYSIKETLI